MYFKKVISSLFGLLFMISLLSGTMNGQQINPSSQILWPLVTGNGAPTASCTSSNYGQPYTDTTNNIQYTCRSTGWQSDLSTAGGTVNGSVNVSAGMIVGATLSTNKFTLNPLATMPAPWTMDVTTPATALSSLGGCGTAGCTFSGAVNMNAPLLVGATLSTNKFYLNPLSPMPATWTMDVTTPATALSSLGGCPTIGCTFSGSVGIPALTLTNPLSAANGGTGVASPTGYAYGNGASTFTFSTTIPYTALSGTPTIPTSADWPNPGTCSSGQFVTTLANGAAPVCATPAGGGNVSGTGTSVSGHFAVFSNTSSTAINDTGYSPSSFDIAGAAAARAGTGACILGQYEITDGTGAPTCATVQYSQLSGTSAITQGATGINANLVPDSSLQFGWSYWSETSGFYTIIPIGETGTNGFQISSGATGQNTDAISQQFHLIAGQEYTFSAYIDNTNASAGGAVWEIYDPTVTTSYASLSMAFGTKGRSNSTFTMPTPSGYSAGQAVPVVLIFDSAGATFTGSLYGAAPMIQAGALETAYVPNVMSNLTTTFSAQNISASSLNLSTPLSITNGGTGATNQSSAFNNIVAPGGTITGTLNLNTPLSSANGGTGVSSPTGYAYGNGASNFTFSTTIPYAALSGTPTIPTSADWPNAGTCTAGEYIAGLTNGTTPSCAVVQYSQLGGTVPTWNQNTTGTAANITATSNSTLTTLSALSLPYSQVTGAPASGVSSVFGRTGAVVAATGDYSVGQVTGAAPLASPTFTGTVSTGNVNIGNNNIKFGFAGITPITGLNTGNYPLFLSNGGDGGNNTFFPFLYENYQDFLMGFVNYGATAYGGVNASSFNNVLEVTGGGAVYTGAPQNTPISDGGNPDITIRNTLDDGAGNASFAGAVSATGLGIGNLTVNGYGQTTIATSVGAPLLTVYEIGSTFGSGSAAISIATDNPTGTDNYYLMGLLAGTPVFNVRADGLVSGSGFVGGGSGLTSLPSNTALYPTLNQNTTGNANTATQLASPPTTCGAGAAAGGILANGDATGCFTPTSTPAGQMHVAAYSSSTTFTIPTGTTTSTVFKVTLVAGGGAGGGGAAGVSGAGGGAGGTCVQYFSGWTPGNTIAVSVGNGGTGSAGATGNGGTITEVASGTQTITPAVANGGNGGYSGTTYNGEGGQGGTYSTTGCNVALSSNGGDGATGASNSTSAGASGGASSRGGGGFGGYGGANNNGNNGEAPGSGGGGGSSNTATAGGSGANGIAIIEWIQ